jgi:hypothetical protein
VGWWNSDKKVRKILNWHVSEASKVIIYWLELGRAEGFFLPNDFVSTLASGGITTWSKQLQ